MSSKTPRAAREDEPPATEEAQGKSAAATAAERVQTAFQLFALGVEMLRTRLRREEPSLSEEEIEERVSRWLATRRGAEHGDAEGRPATWPRQRR